MSKDTLPQLKVGIGWIDLEVISEPDVVLTFKGYAPILYVKKLKTGVEFILYISAKSLGESLEELRSKNEGNFKGIKFRIRKESEDLMAKYEIGQIND